MQWRTQVAFGVSVGLIVHCAFCFTMSYIFQLIQSDALHHFLDLVSYL